MVWLLSRFSLVRDSYSLDSIDTRFACVKQAQQHADSSV
jgi:hypothetical protein